MSEEGNGKRLTTEQREQLITWVAEGLDTEEINKRAAEQQPPWHVSRGAVAHYRKTRKIDRTEIRQQAEAAAIAAGYATVTQRINALTELADRMRQDLLTNGKLWLTRQRAIGPASQVRFVAEEEFNASEVAQYRGALEDIAKELGQRTTNLKIDEEVTVIWDLPVPGWEPPSQPAGSSD